MASITSMTTEFTSGSGNITPCTAMENSNGKTEKGTLGTMFMTKKKALVFTIGLAPIACTLASGKAESKMESENISTPKSFDMDFGKMERGNVGSILKKKPWNL